MGVEQTHSSHMLTSLLISGHILTRMAGQYLPSFLTGNVADTAATAFEGMQPETSQTFTNQTSSFEQMDTSFPEEATSGAPFVGTAQSAATIATMAWNYLPYIGTAVAVAGVAWLGYKAYRSLSRPTVEVVNNNNITVNINNHVPDTIQIQPIVKEVEKDKGKEMRIDLNVTPLTKTVTLLKAATDA